MKALACCLLIGLSCGCRSTFVQFDKSVPVVRNVSGEIPAHGAVIVNRRRVWVPLTPEGPRWLYNDRYAFYFSKPGYPSNDFVFTISKPGYQPQTQMRQAEGVVEVKGRWIKIDVKTLNEAGRWKGLPVNGWWKIDRTYPE